MNELNSRANGTVGMRGTDLGVSFESQGRLYFLFGDSFVMGGGAHLDDAIAVTDARSADRFRMPRLTWAASRDGSFAPLRVPGASHGGMEVPVEGIRAAGRTYVFFVSGWHANTRSYDHQVLGHFGADTMRTGRFVLDHMVRRAHFLNVSAVAYRGHVYLFGAGNPYRQSAVRLARFRPRAIDRPEQWRYLAPTGRTTARRGRRVRAMPGRSSRTTRHAWASCPCAATRGAATSSWPTTATMPTAPARAGTTCGRRVGPGGRGVARSCCSTPRRPTAATVSPSISRPPAGGTPTTASPSPTTSGPRCVRR